MKYDVNRIQVELDTTVCGTLLSCKKTKLVIQLDTYADWLELAAGKQWSVSLLLFSGKI